MARRPPITLAVLAATAALAPAAAAQSPEPTLAWDHPCYTDDQPMVFTGTGYTPGGEVNLLFSRPGTIIGGYRTAADTGGGIEGAVHSTADDMLPAYSERQSIFASANDRTRIDQGAPSEIQFATAQFTFTRWEGFSPGRYVPGRTVQVEAYGWAFAVGKPLYFLFQKGRTTVASVRVGTLGGACGDRARRIRVPKELEPGAYRLVLSTEKRSPSGAYTWRKGRVVRRASASAASVRGTMAHG